MKNKHPQQILDKKRQVTIQFVTVAEAKLWKKWYARSGHRHFSSLMMRYGPKWWETKPGLK
jgi:hypothetical protein